MTDTRVESELFGSDRKLSSRELFGSSRLIIFTRLFVNTIHLHDLVYFLSFCVTHYRIYFRSDNRNSFDRRKWIIVPTNGALLIVVKSFRKSMHLSWSSWGIATRFSTQERGNSSSLPCMIIILSCRGTLSSCESTARTNIDYPRSGLPVTFQWRYKNGTIVQ